MKVTYVRPGKAKSYGRNPNLQIRFRRHDMPATTTANAKRIAALGNLTAQDIFERNYDALERDKIARKKL